MVYRGKPGRGCQRCRERKLRCNLLKPTCGACSRAGAECTGYRDTSALRISDQTEAVRCRALQKRAQGTKTDALSFGSPKKLSLDLQVQARELFYAYYVTDFSRTWDFLLPFLNKTSTPEYLNLSIDAASLAFLHHQTRSGAALDLSHKQYAAALREMRAALGSPETAKVAHAMDASLVLDLFEKISNPGVIEPEDVSVAHVAGSLALIRLRGLSTFRDRASLQGLTRIALNAMVTALYRREPVPEEVVEVRAYAASFIDTTDPKWRLTGLMIECANLLCTSNKDSMERGEILRRCMDLDMRFAQLATDLEKPHRNDIPEIKTERMLEPYYDMTQDRTGTQMTNVVRLTRIMLCEEMTQSSGQATTADSLRMHHHAQPIVEEMIRQICTLTPQMTDCKVDTARDLSKYPGTQSSGKVPTHTLTHSLDVYIILFSLYVAAWSSFCPPETRSWITKEVEYIADRFGVKQAAMVATAMKSEKMIGPWQVYQLLGSYAFAA
ncbi:hypothetical protein BU24DRAFT_426444 [Aaosphaeria arxii CBS 175.79]|uniref:Zn(2)-C6 fungal-type domain-containing protein n=1 Tax=Aaosphaeria arxii CBS 175.79 TaxID=1450172 RepID=A0A6A5XEX5_9PLEO|nr:uncharacterized protein BU24DRAFT_426444 [Aaosphaeria arxii CBS 175.79]KAF2011367.1 hypothetical protein BU24DRAFT_426444 [Aaosphaeria arxii CBS 175.79]